VRLDVKLRVGLAAFAGLALVGSAAFASTLRSSESASKPVLSVTSGSPLEVAGRGFEAGERVTVVASVSQGQFRKTLSANRRGRFTARFSAPFTGCRPAYVVAVGREGSRASLRIRGVPPPCGIDPAPGLGLNG
jgi:hypothetical protein